MVIKKYSKSKNGGEQLSPNFTVREFACKDGTDLILIDDELVNLLQQVRDHFQVPVTVNSAYRTAAYNAKIGGVKNSQHVLGMAADIVVKDVTPIAVAQYAEYLGAKGIGLYSDFVHLDTRKGAKSRWINKGKEVAVSGFPGYQEPQAPAEPEAPAAKDSLSIEIYDGAGELVTALQGRLDGGTTWAPLRQVAEALKATVIFDQETIRIIAP